MVCATHWWYNCGWFTITLRNAWTGCKILNMFFLLSNTRYPSYPRYPTKSLLNGCCFQEKMGTRWTAGPGLVPLSMTLERYKKHPWITLWQRYVKCLFAKMAHRNTGYLPNMGTWLCFPWYFIVLPGLSISKHPWFLRFEPVSSPGLNSSTCRTNQWRRCHGTW